MELVQNGQPLAQRQGGEAYADAAVGAGCGGGKCMAVECQLDPGGVGTELCAVGQVDAALKGWCQVWCLCLGGGGLELGAGGLLAQAVQGLPMGFL